MVKSRLRGLDVYRRLISGVVLIMLIACICQPVYGEIPLPGQIIQPSIPPIIYMSFLKTSVQASPVNIDVDATSSLTMTVLYPNDTPVQNANVKLKASGGTLGSASGFTNSQGKYTTTFKSSSSGSFIINVTSNKTGYYDGTASVAITVKNNPPTAYFSANPVSGMAPLKVDFDASGSTDVGGSITKYEWSFGDGSNGTGKTVSHTYNSVGTFYASLTVTDNLGIKNSYSSQVLVGAVNKAPSAKYSVTKTSGPAPLSVDFDASESTDQDGTIASYTWAFGDGETGTGKTASHEYAAAGTYNAILTVTDNLGTTSTYNQTITVSEGGFLTGGMIMLLAILGLLVLVALAVLGFLWLKNDLRIIPKKASAPCDGKSTIPIKVQFVNGLGMVKKQGSDVEVELESSAGKIQSVIIPNGREFVEASLTASNEFGPVTVTAKAKGKSVKADLKFEYKQATFDVTITPDSIPADGKSSANVVIKIKDESGNFIAPINELPVSLKATLGTIAGEVKIPSKTQSISISLTSGEVSGTSIITAISGNIKGEGKATFKGLPKRFCMHCGSPMEMEASVCPKCGLTPPSGVDTKQCPSCGTILPEAAKFCYNCGAKQPDIKK
jgi:PKD repeat protein